MARSKKQRKRKAINFKHYVSKRSKASGSLAAYLQEGSEEEAPKNTEANEEQELSAYCEPETGAFDDAGIIDFETLDKDLDTEESESHIVDFEENLSNIGAAEVQDDFQFGGDTEPDPPERAQHAGIGSSDDDLPPPSGMDAFASFIVQLQARKHVSKDFCSQIMAYMCSNSEAISHDLSEGWSKSFSACHRKALRRTPKVRLDVKASTCDGLDVYFKGVTKFPKKRIDKRGLKEEYTLYYVSLQDLVEFHRKGHPMGTDDGTIDIAVDGVPETKSGGVSIDVLSVGFPGCRIVYPLAILRPSRSGMSLPESIIFEPLLRDLTKCSLSVRLVIADAPKRAKVLGIVGHSGKMPCQYCYAKASTEGKHKFFPPATNSNCRLRTNRGLRRAAKAQQRANARQKGRKRVQTAVSGVKEVSVLSAIPSLDLIHQVPTERMHLADLGIVRKMARLTFEGRVKYKTPYKASNMHGLNRLLVLIRTPSECSRRSRPMHLGYWKSEEWRNLYLFMFPCVLEVVRPELQEIWRLTVYILRALMLPDEFYKPIKDDMPELVRRWYFEFKEAFGKYACSYNVHTFFHVLEVRKHGPLTESSAVKYESLYGYLKECFAGGTCSTGKQGLQAAYLKYTERHACARSLTINGKTTSKRDDSIVYTKDHLLLKVDESTRNGATIRGKELRVKKGYFLVPGMDFNDVLVYEVEEEMSATRTIHQVRHDDIIGKGARVNKVVSILTTNMLTEL